MKKLLILAFIVLVFISSMSFALAQDCEEQWVCKDWSRCKDGTRTRTCTDNNECGTDLYKPFETEPCSEGETATTTSITTDGDMLFLAVLIVVLVVGASGILLYRKRKK